MFAKRTYFVLALLTVFCAQATPHQTPDMNNVVSPEAQWHYGKQALYGAFEGGALLLATQAFCGSPTPATSQGQAFQALVGLCGSFAASRCIRNYAESNKKGAEDSSPVLAFAANAAGLVAVGGTIATIMMRK